MSTFNQGVPGVPTLINSSAVLVTGNAASANALTVRQFGTGNVFSAQTTTGSTALFVGANGNVGVGTTNPQTALDVFTGTMNAATVSATTLTGAGSGITALNMGNAGSGTLAVARGGTGVTSSTGTGSVVLSASPTLTGTVTAATVSATTLTGDGSGVTSLNMGNAGSGTLAVARGGTGVTSSTGSGSVVLSAGPTLSGTVTGGTFSGTHTGDGSGVTSLNMGNAGSGTLAVARGGTGVTSSTGSGSVVLSASPALSGTATFASITTSGNVGIGIAGPATTLQVNGDFLMGQGAGSFGYNSMAIQYDGNTNYGSIIGKSVKWDGTNYIVQTDGATPRCCALQMSFDNGFKFVTTSASGVSNLTLSPAQFLANTKVVITLGGNVGIGTASPTYLLDMSGGDIRTQNGGNVGGAGGAINFGANVGYGPMAQIKGALDTAAGSVNDQGSVVFLTRPQEVSPYTVRTNLTERMRITSGGNVGINTPSPSYLLHVNGTFASSGRLFSGVNAYAGYTYTFSVVGTYLVTYYYGNYQDMNVCGTWIINVANLAYRTPIGANPAGYLTVTNNSNMTITFGTTGLPGAYNNANYNCAYQLLL